MAPDDGRAEGTAPSPAGEDPARLARTAREAADAAAEVHLARLGRFSVDTALEKSASDFVSEVDLESQEAALSVIRSRHPHHRILAEEAEGDAAEMDGGAAEEMGREAEGEMDGEMDSEAEGETDGKPKAEREVASGAGEDILWIVDPLDGTTNYLHRHPMYCASVGVTRAGAPIAGAVTAAATGERWWAWEGGGAWKEDRGGPTRAISVSAPEEVGRMLIGTGFPFKKLDRLPAYLAQFERVLRRTSGIRRGGSAALDLCYLAEGIFDGFWELWLSPWDIAAGAAIVSEAGGRVARLDGTPPVIEEPGSLLAACSDEILRTLGALLREA